MCVLVFMLLRCMRCCCVFRFSVCSGSVLLRLVLFWRFCLVLLMCCLCGSGLRLSLLSLMLYWDVVSFWFCCWWFGWCVCLLVLLLSLMFLRIWLSVCSCGIDLFCWVWVFCWLICLCVMFLSFRWGRSWSLFGGSCCWSVCCRMIVFFLG